MRESEEYCRILLADDNPDHLRQLSESLSEEQDFRIIGQAADGLEVRDHILALRPDVVVTGVIMPEMDAIDLLRWARDHESERMPIFILLSALRQNSTIRLAKYLGARAYFFKPCRREDLVHCIRSHHQGTGERYFPIDDDWTVVTGVLNEAGIPAHLQGYRYLITAIRTVAECRRTGLSLAGPLYTVIAELFDTEPLLVERSVRNALTVAWEKGRLADVWPVWKKNRGKKGKRPAGRPFIETAAALYAARKAEQEALGLSREGFL